MADRRRSRKTPLSLNDRHNRLLQDLSAPPSTLSTMMVFPNFSGITDSDSPPLRNYHINYLATRGPDLEPFVVGSLIQLLCRATNFGWLDDDRFKEAMNFLSQYENCGMYIMKIMEPILQLYVDGVNLQCGADNIQLSLAEVKLAWIVHIVVAILKKMYLVQNFPPVFGS
ncbi:hypothetical protein RGQ29_027013 [Quercus rubra]|uniref:Exportin-7/Ran-binding protein 17 TPR repeats domain-containing protein n=1 Tax=Quercus rubra TaxID=3512 RepID=A0AAN7EP75_QUERU|nr:hypothetical protein RGQ29_027013 [Quercus rubra]KAK4576282.1 hypothetical protein RGQ29_027013 [Quercus rubra]